MDARRPTMAMAHARVLSNSVNLKRPVLVRDVVDMHRPVAALGREIFVQGVPCDTLDVVIVLGNFVYAFAWVLIVRTHVQTR